ncbi:hypothetical protein IAS59_002239 [Cryptococcus gattii]
MSANNLVQINSPEHFKDLLSADLNRVSCLNFWAPWAEPCVAFNSAVEKEAGQFPSVLFLNIEAEQLADISESFDIEAVPSFLILRVSPVSRSPACFLPPQAFFKGRSYVLSSSFVR